MRYFALPNDGLFVLQFCRNGDSVICYQNRQYVRLDANQYCEQQEKSNLTGVTLLPVMEDIKKIAERTDRKKRCAPVRKKFPMLALRNENRLLARFRTSPSKNERKPCSGQIGLTSCTSESPRMVSFRSKGIPDQR